MSGNIICDSRYLDDVLLGPEGLEKVVHDVTSTVLEKAGKFDAIAFRGMSGALVAPAVSLRLSKHLVMVRKKNEDCHSSSLIEGAVSGEFSYIIVDDFVATGETVLDIQKTIWHKNPSAHCIGMCLYRFGASYHTPANWRTGNSQFWFKPPEPLAPPPIFIEQPVTESETNDYMKYAMATAAYGNLSPAP